MMHKTRRWNVADVGTEEELAEKLTEHTWTGCTGFRLSGYLFLNDSTSADGAQEYGIVKESTREQVESITFGWCDYYRALMYICEIVAGRYTEVYTAIPAGSIDNDKAHRCYACA